MPRGFRKLSETEVFVGGDPHVSCRCVTMTRDEKNPPSEAPGQRPRRAACDTTHSGPSPMSRSVNSFASNAFDFRGSPARGGKILVAGARIRPRLLERSPTPLPPSSRLPSRRSTKGRGGLVGRALEVELRCDRAADLRLHEPRLGLHGDVGGHFAGEVDEVVDPALHGP